MPVFTIIIQVAITSCILIYATIYIIGIRAARIQPILATWLFLALATVLSFVTNFSQTGVHGMLANSFNIIDTLATIIIFLFVMTSKHVRKRLTFFEGWCLGAVVIIFIFWLVSKQNIAAHLSIQAILVTAYLPTFAHLWMTAKNTESLSMWSFDGLASLFGIIEPLRRWDILPLVYTLRSVTSAVVIIVLILRIKYRARTFGSQ